MTGDFDVDLRERLAALATAVPVEAGSRMHAPIAPVVRPGLTGRRVATGAPFALVIVVVGIVVASLAHVGPFAPAATGGPPVVATVRDGAFDLTITSAKARYALGEPIGVTASVTFRGPEGSVSIFHGQGSPMAFGVIERVGGLFLTPAWRQSCEPSVLEKDVPLVRPFAKSGSFSGDNPAATDASGFFKDPTLVLPAGIWHLYVVADFGVGDCGQDRHLMRVDLEIGVQVTPEGTPDVSPSIVPPAPQPTLQPTEGPRQGLPGPTDATDPPVSGEADDGPAVLQLKSPHTRYIEGTPIELEARYWFADGLALVASRYEPELLLSITQLDATNPTGRLTSYDTVCTDLGRVDGTERQVALAGYNIALMRADRVPAHLEDLFVDGALVLPVGRWEINANVEGRFAPCGQAGDGYALSASIVIEVVPG